MKDSAGVERAYGKVYNIQPDIKNNKKKLYIYK